MKLEDFKGNSVEIRGEKEYNQEYDGERCQECGCLNLVYEENEDDGTTTITCSDCGWETTKE